MKKKKKEKIGEGQEERGVKGKNKKGDPGTGAGAARG